jgi:hypothetical protein
MEQISWGEGRGDLRVDEMTTLKCVYEKYIVEGVSRFNWLMILSNDSTVMNIRVPQTEENF